MAHDAAEAEVRRVAADLVGAGLARFGIDPAKQRLESDLVVRVGEKIDEQRDAAARLLRVAIHGVAFGAAVALQRGDGVSHVRRLDVLPVQVRGIAPDRQLESIGQALPQLGERRVEAADRLDVGAKRTHARGDTDDRQRDG